MTYGQAGAVCPQCGSAAAVHSIAEWAAMAQGPTGGPRQAYGPVPPTGFPDPSQGQQTGFPDPSQYQQTGFPDRSQYQETGFPDPGTYQQQPGFPHPSPDPPPPNPTGAWQEEDQPPPRRPVGWDGTGDANSFEDVIADAVLGAATKALGRAFGLRARRTFNERVAPSMAARREAMQRERMAIAQRHPDLCACLNDQLVFLAGGTRVLPLASAFAVSTVEQSDALVARLRNR